MVQHACRSLKVTIEFDDGRIVELGPLQEASEIRCDAHEVIDPPDMVHTGNRSYTTDDPRRASLTLTARWWTTPKRSPAEAYRDEVQREADAFTERNFPGAPPPLVTIPPAVEMSDEDRARTVETAGRVLGEAERQTDAFLGALAAAASVAPTTRVSDEDCDRATAGYFEAGRARADRDALLEARATIERLTREKDEARTEGARAMGIAALAIVIAEMDSDSPDLRAARDKIRWLKPAIVAARWAGSKWAERVWREAHRHVRSLTFEQAAGPYTGRTDEQREEYQAAWNRWRELQGATAPATKKGQ